MVIVHAQVGFLPRVDRSLDVAGAGCERERFVLCYARVSHEH